MKTRIILLAVAAVLAMGCSDDDNKAAVSAPVEGINDTSAQIPDNNPQFPLISQINIEDTGVISHPERVSVSVELMHTFAGDLTVELIAPNGQSMPLIKRLGVNNTTGFGLPANFAEGNILVFNSGYETLLPVNGLATDSFVPAGNYKPTGEDSASPIALLMIDMADFLNGKNINGAWRLRVADYSQADLGSLLSWKINFDEGALN